ncbi:MAG: dihydroorotate dehydrogenase-like protein [Candidatus Omnitrophota bacterium]
MDLSTQYMGLALKNPLVVSSAPLTKEPDNFKKLEDAGVGAITCHSIFEEQLTQESLELNQALQQGTEQFAEALNYFPEQEDYKVGPEEYLKMISDAKSAVDVPIIASLNGHTMGGWVDYAKKIEEAGADGLELNVYFLPTKTDTTPDEVENNYEAIVHAVKKSVSIPVAVKLSPYFSAMANFAKCIDQAGADALVMFNRFYQPDLDLDKLEVVPNVVLSTSNELRLPLRWIAILYKHVEASMAATSGIHSGEDIVKVIMAGADAAMSCSALLKNGIGHAQTMVDQLSGWMEAHEYESVQQMKGILSQQKCEHPESFERANYMKALTIYDSVE